MEQSVVEFFAQSANVARDRCLGDAQLGGCGAYGSKTDDRGEKMPCGL